MKLFLLAWLAILQVFAQDFQGRQFIGMSQFAAFNKERLRDSIVLTSPVLDSKIDWDELILSWNVDLRPRDGLKIEARVLTGGGPSPYYVLGFWAQATNQPRESVRGQKDDIARVDTDTLLLRAKHKQMQVRITLSSDQSRLKFLGVSLMDSAFKGTANTAEIGATQLWAVPERSQMAYPDGSAWCSPTSTSMVLAYWGEKLHRPELIQDVPVVADAVNDTKWPGTGNWPFNTAYAGGFAGMRAYVTRLSGPDEIKQWLDAGVPVVASVAYGILKGKELRDGHLIVVVGFNDKGEIVVNDPGTRLNVRKVFPQENFIRAWAHSRNTVYLIYPENQQIPPALTEHWERRAP